MTLAPTLSDTYAGIAPSSVLPFVVAQLAGAAVACAAVRFLWPRVGEEAEVLVVPHQQEVRVG